ncbi:MAG: C1 family peptidase [Hyphomicrobiales bacterium]|nr:C1 family peptidase [Hyphomicrobiales bacterium]
MADKANDFKGFQPDAVVKDRPDLRDLSYAPSLRPLHPRVGPPATLLKNLARRRLIDRLVRNQLEGPGAGSGSCTAQALAAVIDLLRLDGSAGNKQTVDTLRVSAEMLYDEGRLIEAAELGKSQPAEGLRSLRSAIKGYYHNGVCTETVWKASRTGSDRDVVAVAKAARQITLGAYYRVQPILNDYHTALNHVGAIFAAAEIHPGWAPDAVEKNNGRIDIRLATGEAVGHHAFVIVGYDEDGFLILNSWGPEWGGYCPASAPAESPGWPGIGHWRYQDWAERVIDGWVLRLGVPTSNAFEYSLGEQGLGAFMAGAIRSGSTPRHDLAGHYVHLDDGAFVGTGAFPSSAESATSTVDLLNQRVVEKRALSEGDPGPDRSYSRVLLWIAGGNERTKDAVTDAVVTKQFWMSQGIYPITVLWCSDFIESTLVVLDRLFEAALAKAGKVGAELDKRIDIEARGIGRAFWRDIKGSAKRAARKGDRYAAKGGMFELFEALARLDPEIELHVVAEGAGAILLADLFDMLAAMGSDPPETSPIKRLATVTLLAPACTTQALEEPLGLWRKETRRKILMLTPSEATSSRMTTGLYQQSILDLVQRSFEEEVPGDRGQLPHKRARILGTSRAATAADRSDDSVRLRWLEAAGTGPITRLRSVTFSAEALGRIAGHIGGKGEIAAPQIEREHSGPEPGSKPGHTHHT